jgi:hypothetical protein
MTAELSARPATSIAGHFICPFSMPAVAVMDFLVCSGTATQHRGE